MAKPKIEVEDRNVLVLKFTNFKIKAVYAMSRWDGSVWFYDDKACIVSMGNTSLAALLGDLHKQTARMILGEISSASCIFGDYIKETGYPHRKGGDSDG